LVACDFDFGPDDEDASQAVADFIINVTQDADDILLVVDIQDDGTLTYVFTGNRGMAEIEVQMQDDGETNNGGEDTSPTKILEVIVQDFIFVNGFEGLVCPN